MNSEDPTKIVLQTNIKKENDPTLIRMSGVAIHGNTPFDVPFISQIKDNLWQGGCQNGLQLPHFFKHIISLYPWESYRINHDMNTQVYIKMYDSLDQSMEQVDIIANLINICVKDGPTLVHCQAGLNRSSLVVARSLMLRQDDWDRQFNVDEAISLLRENRSPAILCNTAFENHLRNL